jgi:hypothetical protein
MDRLFRMLLIIAVLAVVATGGAMLYRARQSNQNIAKIRATKSTLRCMSWLASEYWAETGRPPETLDDLREMWNRNQEQDVV